MSWSSLRGDINTLLSAVSGIEEISALPKTDFSGYPAVSISPNELESEPLSKSELLRHYEFSLLVFYDSNKDGWGNAINQVEETVDAIIAKIIQEEQLGATRTIGASLGTSDTMLAVQPLVSNWQFIDIGFVIAEIIVRIKTIHKLE